jgi:hypothetical protein
MTTAKIKGIKCKVKFFIVLVIFLIENFQVENVPNLANTVNSNRNAGVKKANTLLHKLKMLMCVCGHLPSESESTSSCDDADYEGSESNSVDFTVHRDTKHTKGYDSEEAFLRVNVMLILLGYVFRFAFYDCLEF